MELGKLKQLMRLRWLHPSPSQQYISIHKSTTKNNFFFLTYRIENNKGKIVPPRGNQQKTQMLMSTYGDYVTEMY